jgi:hypothetical protein
MINLRVLEPASPAELFALHTSRVVWIALDLFLSACDASDGQSLARLASLGHAPVSVDCLSVYHGLAVATIVVKVAQALARYLCCPDESREKVRPCPNLRT